MNNVIRNMIYTPFQTYVIALIGPDLLAVAARLSMAAIFWLAGRTKVTGWLEVTENAVDLFQTEYQLPLIDPTIAAHLATYGEHLLPIMLVLGLGTRFAAFGMLAMTAVIQIFVYPDAWPTHLAWAALLLVLVRHGAGRLSLDALVVHKYPALAFTINPTR
jgi:putative oxidoreductase